MKYILQDRDKFFKEWTGIGPACTPNIEEAEIFDSKEEAMKSPAYTFSLTFFEPIIKN